MRRPLNTARIALLAVIVAGLLAGGTGAVHAAWFSSTSNPTSSFSAKRIFTAARTTSSWDLNDQSTGTNANVGDPFWAAGDSLVRTTKNWATSFAATRYLDFDLVASRPAGLTVTSPTFDFRFRPTTSTDTVCIYFEVRSISSGSVIATYGSAGTPLSPCVTGTSYTTISTSIPAISTTDLMNDLRVRVYVRNNTGARSIQVDQATVSGTDFGSFTLYPTSHVDRADTTVLTVPWILAAADGTAYATSNWTTAYGGTRYLTFGVDGFVPPGATVTGATLTHRYRSTRNGSNFCYYLEVYDGATLVGSHGSTGSDVSCNSSNSTWVSDTVPLTEITSVSRANNMVIRLYGKSSSPARASEHDLVQVDITYYLD